MRLRTRAAVAAMLALPCLPSAAALGQRSASLSRSTPATVLFDVTREEGIWARGATYKAGFDAGGAVFLPFLGSSAPKDFPLRLSLREVELAGESQAFSRSAAPRLEGTTVVLERGSVTELYRVEPESLEQLFRFDALPLRGELVLRIDCETELSPFADAGGVRFQGEHGAARYGRAIAIDARGRRVDAPVALIAGGLEIHVPASFVERAALPLVIDPLLTTFAVDDSHAVDTLPDIAYDASLDVYAVCWERWFSAMDRDIHCAILDGAGNVVREFLIDATPTTLRMPRIAGVDAFDRFLVAAITGNEAEGKLELRLVDLAGGQVSVGAPWTPLQWTYSELCVAGDSGAGPSAYFAVVAEDDYLGYARLVDFLGYTAAGALAGIETFGYDDDDSNWYPRLCRDLGGPADAPAAWTLAKQGGTLYGSGSVGVVRIRPDATTASFQTVHGSGATTLDCAQVVDSATGEPTDVVVYTKLASVYMKARRGLVFGGEVQVDAQPGTSSNDAVIDGDGSSFVVVYAQMPGPSSIFAASYVVEDLELVLTERVLLHASSSTSKRPRMIANRSGGGEQGRFAAVWQEGTGDIYAAFYETAGPGVPYCATSPNSVGPGATIHAAGGISIELDEFELLARGCPPNRPGLFYLGQNQIQLPFGDGLRCIGGATRRITPILTTDAAGAASLLLDFDEPYGDLVQPGAPGVNYQFWYRDPAGGPAQFNLSDALRVEHTP